MAVNEMFLSEVVELEDFLYFRVVVKVIHALIFSLKKKKKKKSQKLVYIIYNKYNE